MSASVCPYCECDIDFLEEFNRWRCVVCLREWAPLGKLVVGAPDRPTLVLGELDRWWEHI